MLRDPEKVKNEIVEWIRSYFEENGKGCKAVIGISGGKDSSIAAALCAEALGRDRVVGVLMPTADAQLGLGVIAGLCAANLVAVIMLYYKKRK